MTPHTNVFADEALFLDHYARARHIARHPLNHVRTCDGMDILGVPHLDEEGNVVEVDGRPTWRQVPVGGWVPDIDRWVEKTPDAAVATQLHHVNTRMYEPPPEALWLEVSAIAPHLQSTLLVGSSADDIPRLACRVTPEVRLERAPDTTVVVPVRTLSLEWRMASRVDITAAMVSDLLDQQAPLLRLWYPLAESLARTAHTSRTERTTNLLIRVRARHDVGSLVSA